MTLSELQAAREAAVQGTVRRTYDARLSVRASSKGNGLITLDGYASTTEQPYSMWDMFGEYQEVISAGAFGKTLAEGPDVAFLLNHGGMTLARTKSGTLELSEDETGLRSVATLDSRVQAVRDIQIQVERGDLDEMSFAFRITRWKWSPDYTELRIDEVSLHRGDTSVVNFGANPNTSIAQRSMDMLRGVEHLSDDQLSKLGLARVKVTPPEPAWASSAWEL